MGDRGVSGSDEAQFISVYASDDRTGRADEFLARLLSEATSKDEYTSHDCQRRKRRSFPIRTKQRLG